jgi:RNA polymerase sigma factor (sigma-70 family)
MFMSACVQRPYWVETGNPREHYRSLRGVGDSAFQTLYWPSDSRSMPAESLRPDKSESSPRLFKTTHWSMVRGAQAQSETALNLLFESYRQPLLVWLLARHYSAPDAEDLLQSYFAALLRHDFLRSISPEKGKFRTFLLTALKNHLHDARDKAMAQKRGGGVVVQSLQDSDSEGLPVCDPASTEATPDIEFDRAWAKAVLDRALRRLEAECSRTGHAALCTELEPVMFADPTAASYRQIGEKLGMSEGAVNVAAHRIRARFRGIIREEIAHTVDNEQDLRSELVYFTKLFGNTAF